MKSTGHCSLLDLVLFFATAIGIATGQFSVRSCGFNDELGTPSVTYEFTTDSTVCPDVNRNWGFRAGDGVGNGMFTVTNEAIANSSCVEGNELRVKPAALSAVVPGTFNISFVIDSTSAEIQLQVNYFPKGFYLLFDNLVFPLKMDEDPPRPWSSYDIAGLSVKLCEEEAGGGLTESTLFIRTPVRQEQCLEGMGQVESTFSGPNVYEITLERMTISEEDVGTYMLVLVEGANCQSPTLTSDPVTVNVSLPAPEPNLTTSMTPTSTSIFTIPTPSPNSSTVTSTPTPNPTDDPSPPSGSGGPSTGELAGIIVVGVVVVVLLGVGVILFVVCCWKKPYRRKKHSFSHDADADLSERYHQAPGQGPSVTELSESVKPPIEGTVVTARPSTEVVQPPKSSVFITAEDSAFYKDLRKRLANECHTSVHQPDLTDHRHFPQLISRLLIDQNCEWLFLIVSHTLEHRVVNGLDDSTNVPVWRAMQELTVAAYPEDQLSKVVYVQLGAPSLRTIETPITTILIPSSSNTPNYTGTQCADDILKDPKVKKRLEKKTAVNGIAKPPSLVPRQIERLLGEPPASDPTHRRGVEQPDGATESGSLMNRAIESGSLDMLKSIKGTVDEQLEVLKDLRDIKATQTDIQAAIARNTGKTASNTGESKKDTAEIRQNTQQILDQQQGAEGGEDKTENVT